jgi:very-short-patch-repair endonuclease
VRLRTFLGMKSSLSPRVEAALAKFTAAIARLGKGTGKTAGRFRRIIREAALDAARAVPCWILPEWRVAEQLPAELGSFDLVVIDEASQSDITALPAILRGKKVLIVGDDKQVSPTPVGIEDRKVLQLKTTFLTGIPFADQMDPATSLYELAGMVYPGRAIILREHFRCVEPIISFSSHFYPKPLIPLRLPTASERLNPPLIDLYVPHGRRVREVNEAEVDVIVTEIRKMVADPAFEGRSIGVISLIGNAQANRIYTRLITELGAEVIEKHRIMCGNAATFQGQERDIVFLSMVACPETAVAQTSRVFEQRFNVAASRARDRLILVRSVASSDLKPGDLKLALIEHFRAPMKGNVIRPKEVLEVCESGFERDFGLCLLDLGYRIRPQVSVGGYAIDFVVEGSDDRRLAIELDGDKYHGPDRWAEDIKRQRALERLGWTFWRCWGSAWISDREGCLADLMATIHRLGIEPIGTGEIDRAYTEHIEVRVQTDAEPVMEESVPVEPLPVQPAFQFGQAIPRERSRKRSRGTPQRVLPLGFAARQSDRAGPTTLEPTVEPLGEGVSSRSGNELISAPPVVHDTTGQVGSLRIWTALLSRLEISCSSATTINLIDA